MGCDRFLCVLIDSHIVLVHPYATLRVLMGSLEVCIRPYGFHRVFTRPYASLWVLMGPYRS